MSTMCDVIHTSLVCAFFKHPCLRGHRGLVPTSLRPGSGCDHTHTDTLFLLLSNVFYMIIIDHLRDTGHTGLWGVKWQGTLCAPAHRMKERTNVMRINI